MDEECGVNRLIKFAHVCRFLPQTVLPKMNWMFLDWNSIYVTIEAYIVEIVKLKY